MAISFMGGAATQVNTAEQWLDQTRVVVLGATTRALTTQQIMSSARMGSSTGIGCGAQCTISFGYVTAFIRSSITARRA